MPNEKMPWEMDLSVPTNTVQSAPEQPTGASTAPAVQNPWDMDLGASRVPVRVPKAVATKSATAATPADWSQVNQQYAAGQSQRNQDQLFTLQAELAKEKNPQNIAALKREISRLQ